MSANSDYRDTLFTSIPTLEVVDRKDKEGNVIEEEEELEDE